SCAFSPDGARVLSASWDNTLKLWDVESGKEIRAFTGHKHYVYSCAFSPDGARVLSASWDNTLKLWDVESGKEIRAFTGHKNDVNSCAFSPDGARVLSASSDNTLKLWDTATGKELKSLELPWIPYYVAFSPQHPGKVITANLNGTVTMFEFEE
ncbi:MAG: WD40 repeat domain-containing protein, partial [FCB group bacterium]|nr:WD40 repeat domain-containing protein [FCB group bacterium]